MKTNFPEGFQEKFFRVTQSNVAETLRRENVNMVYVPCGLKTEYIDVPDKEHYEEGEEVTYHKELDAHWISVLIPYRGEDLSKPEEFYKARYSELRKFFYGTAEQQVEMQSDNTWAAHVDAVKLMFPKFSGEMPESYIRFIGYRKEFWTLIHGLLAQYGNGKTIADMPETFNAGYLLEMGEELQIPTETILQLTLKIQTLALNLIANGYGWVNLFPFKPEYIAE